jgi:hypothetical protein
MRTHKLLLIAVVVLSVLLVVLVIFKLNHETAAKKPKDTARVAVNSQFSFDAKAAPEWRQGPANKMSMALFYEKGDCFVSFENKTVPADEVTSLEQIKSGMVANGYTVADLGSHSLTLKQPGTGTSYVLHQYSATGGDSNGLYKNQEYAFVSMAKGHVFIQGYCDNPDDLPDTLTALSAVTFKP